MLPKNSKKSVISTIVLTIAMAMSCLNAQDSHAQNAMSREHQHAKKELTEGKLRMQLSFLCDSLCHGRGFATQGGSEAAFWIIREKKRMKLPFHLLQSLKRFSKRKLQNGEENGAGVLFECKTGSCLTSNISSVSWNCAD